MEFKAPPKATEVNDIHFYGCNICKKMYPEENFKYLNKIHDIGICNSKECYDNVGGKDTFNDFIELLNGLQEIDELVDVEFEKCKVKTETGTVNLEETFSKFAEVLEKMLEDEFEEKAEEAQKIHQSTKLKEAWGLYHDCMRKYKKDMKKGKIPYLKKPDELINNIDHYKHSFAKILKQPSSKIYRQIRKGKLLSFPGTGIEVLNYLDFMATHF